MPRSTYLVKLCSLLVISVSSRSYALALAVEPEKGSHNSTIRVTMIHELQTWYNADRAMLIRALVASYKAWIEFKSSGLHLQRAVSKALTTAFVTVLGTCTSMSH
eukprot:4833085-Amphidinium_carterae.1